MSEASIRALRSRRVISDGEERAATVVIADGKIADILDWQAEPGCPLEDLGDKVLMPGLVDTHVHINEPGRTEWEGFDTATQAAAAGGITTVVDMPLNCIPVTTTVAALEEKLTAVQDQLWVDCGFWGGVVPDSLDGLDALCRAGILGVKSFTIFSGVDDFPQVEAEHMRAAIPTLAHYDLPYLVHAELDRDNTPPAEIGRSYQSFLASRPRQWENDAIGMVIDLAREAQIRGVRARMHIVHLSSSDAIAMIAAARKEGLAVTAETCPHYLTLWAEACPDGETLFKCCPPIRENENRDKLWQGLADGIIELVVSDHSPCTPQLKHLDSGDLENAWGGISSLQFGLSLIWTEARQRGFSLPEIVEWMASRPARFAGLGERKGRIAPGYDADLVVFDDTGEYLITPEIIKYRHKITPYAGHKVTGRVERTLLRGEDIFRGSDVVGHARGRPLLKQYGTQT
ncbi:allantoinase AllB [Parahaliea maris]|uniref:allantoinase n=1 Tax=Parahaliea maris TaxID=2716870 RepID=A0A5C9A3H5_9GAMM|nr:allantoinase AllB [Parahaliea maris]TXS95318.1 allantoinase AllB [Parahaliea maris]